MANFRNLFLSIIKQAGGNWKKVYESLAELEKNPTGDCGIKPLTDKEMKSLNAVMLMDFNFPNDLKDSFIVPMAIFSNKKIEESLLINEDNTGDRIVLLGSMSNDELEQINSSAKEPVFIVNIDNEELVERVSDLGYDLALLSNNGTDIKELKTIFPYLENINLKNTEIIAESPNNSELAPLQYCGRVGYALANKFVFGEEWTNDLKESEMFSLSHSVANKICKDNGMFIFTSENPFEDADEEIKSIAENKTFSVEEFVNYSKKLSQN